VKLIYFLSWVDRLSDQGSLPILRQTLLYLYVSLHWFNRALEAFLMCNTLLSHFNKECNSNNDKAIIRPYPWYVSPLIFLLSICFLFAMKIKNIIYKKQFNSINIYYIYYIVENINNRFQKINSLNQTYLISSHT
jgi:hypothetical protein